MSERYEVAVLGGGPSGAICARELARRGHSVALLDHGRSRKWPAGELCGPGLRRLFVQACGLQVPPNIGKTLEHFQSSWGSSELDSRSYRFWQAAPGWVLDRELFNEWLLQAAAASGVAVMRGYRARTCRRGETDWCIRYGNEPGGNALRADFVVEATGNMTKSAALDRARRFFSDDLVSLSIVVERKASVGNSALLESSALGWWYAAPIGADRQLVALFTDADLVLSHCRRQTMRDQLARTHHFRTIASIDDGTEIRVASARTSIRTVLWSNAWIAVGDAAWCLDPLSGAGVERAVSDAMSAASAVSAMLRGGGSEPLRAHAQARAEAFLEALVTKQHFYAMEQRWRSQAFWTRRRTEMIPTLRSSVPATVN